MPANHGGRWYGARRQTHRLVMKRHGPPVECGSIGAGEPGCDRPVAQGSDTDMCADCRRAKRARERDARRAGLRADG